MHGKNSGEVDVFERDAVVFSLRSRIHRSMPAAASTARTIEKKSSSAPSAARVAGDARSRTSEAAAIGTPRGMTGVDDERHVLEHLPRRESRREVTLLERLELVLDERRRATLSPITVSISTQSRPPFARA